MNITTYVSPVTEPVEVLFEAHLLDGSVGSVTGPDPVGGWGSSEEDW